MQKLSLRVEFKDRQRMPEEPMGDFFEFETIEDFIDFNREELSVMTEFYPEEFDFAKKVEQKLLDRDFYIEPYTDDCSYIVIRNI